MTTLPKIQKDINSINDKLQEAIETFDDDNFEVELDIFWKQYSIARGALEDKINAWCWVILRLQKETEYYKEQAQRFSQMARASENKVKRMKSYLELTIEEQGGKMPVRDFPKLRLQSNQQKVWIDNDYIGDIPHDLLKEDNLKLEDKLDKTAIKQALKRGESFDFAGLSESTKSLRGLS